MTRELKSEGRGYFPLFGFAKKGKESERKQFLMLDFNEKKRNNIIRKSMGVFGNLKKGKR